VAVGAHAIIGAQAVVREPVPDYAIAVGISAKVIGRRQGAPGPESVTST
jgi:serine acetyltransferase